MTYRSGVVTGVLLTLVILGTAAATYWLVLSKPATAAKTSAASPPAQVAKTLKEEQILTITLPPEALERLALATGTVESKAVRRLHTYGGEIMVPAGQTVMVAAPLSGTLKAAAGGVPQPGQTVTKGQPLFELLPLLTPEGRATILSQRVDADGQYKSALAQLDQADKAYKRAESMFKKETASKRTVEEAKRDYDVAQETVKATKARRDLLQQVAGSFDGGTAAAIAIECPEQGMLRNVSALPGQNVPLGANLFEIARLEQVWVRVPVYVGDQPEIDLAAEALVGNLTGGGDSPKQPAKTAAAPPSANPATGTVDLFYQLDNHDRKYSPGQRVGVTLTFRTAPQSLTVPWKAVIHDIYGGTWVYRQTAERTFVRERVLVRYVHGDTAVLAAGPAPGTKVVTAGAAELFGTETGFTK